MATLAEIRKKYPQYDRVPDQQLADALYKKYYPKADRAEFDKRIGLTVAPVKPVNASGAPDDRGTIPLANPAADPNVPVANATGGPDERVATITPDTTSAAAGAPTKALIDSGRDNILSLIHISEPTRPY